MNPKTHLRNPNKNRKGKYTAPCGYWSRGGYGMTVADLKNVTCPRCKKLIRETKP